MEINAVSILALMLSLAAIAIALEAIRRLNHCRRAHAALSEQVVELGVQLAKQGRPAGTGHPPAASGPTLRRAP